MIYLFEVSSDLDSYKDMPVCFLEVLSQIFAITHKIFECQIDRCFDATHVFYMFFRNVSCKTFFPFLISDDYQVSSGTFFSKSNNIRL